MKSARMIGRLMICACAVRCRPHQTGPVCRRFWSRLLDDRRGATALEFAAVGPASILLLFIIIETAWQLTVDLALNIGVMAGSRYAVTGAGYTAGTRDSTILSTITSTSGGILIPANLSLTSKAYASPLSYGAGGSTIASTGSSRQLVIYTVSYQQTFFTGLAATVLGYSSITHTATLIVQNEPF